jgi:hypothetical protein
MTGRRIAMSRDEKNLAAILYSYVNPALNAA